MEKNSMNGGLGRCLLDQRLHERGWDRNKLIKATGFNFRMISFWTTNARVMSLPSALIVSNVLKCSVQDLYELGNRLTEQ